MSQIVVAESGTETERRRGGGGDWLFFRFSDSEFPFARISDLCEVQFLYSSIVSSGRTTVKVAVA